MKIIDLLDDRSILLDGRVADKKEIGRAHV